MGEGRARAGCPIDVTRPDPKDYDLTLVRVKSFLEAMEHLPRPPQYEFERDPVDTEALAREAICGDTKCAPPTSEPYWVYQLDVHATGVYEPHYVIADGSGLLVYSPGLVKAYTYGSSHNGQLCSPYDEIAVELERHILHVRRVTAATAEPEFVPEEERTGHEGETQCSTHALDVSDLFFDADEAKPLLEITHRLPGQHGKPLSLSWTESEVAVACTGRSDHIAFRAAEAR